jgi:AhpD family alkylhydroperoxidase
MFLSNEANQLYDRFADPAYAAGAIDVKTKELIALACSVMVDCVPCIEWHHRQAVAHGASTAEVQEALAITMTVSAGSKRAKYRSLIAKLSQAADDR